MRRVVPLVALIACLATPARVGAADPAPARVLLDECARGPAAADRFAAWEGRMRRVRGAERMQMRFGLQAREPGELRWRSIAAAGLGVWLTADPGVGRYAFLKRVENLIAPADYRMVVRFRWQDAGGRTLLTLREVARTCQQPDLRPDLRATGVEVLPAGGPQRRRYVVGVRNAGRSAAGGFDVLLTVAGRPLPAAAVLGLAPGERTTVAFEAAGCEPGTSLDVTVDPGALVDERDEEENTLSAPCPEQQPSG